MAITNDDVKLLKQLAMAANSGQWMPLHWLKSS